jgi:tetratricopeptide (TPR) repeat protein
MEKRQFEEDRLRFVNQVETLIGQKMFPEAMKLAEDRLSILPFDADARAFIISLGIKMDNIEENRDKIAALDTDIVRLSVIYLKAADAYREKGMNRDAILCYRKFLAINHFSGNSKEIFEKIALLQGDENYIDDTAELDELNDENSPSPEFYTMTLAELYIRQGHAKIAEEILQEIIKREPENDEAKKKLDEVKTMLTPNLSSVVNNAAKANRLINTLTCWLNNIDRLKYHATG